MKVVLNVCQGSMELLHKVYSHVMKFRPSLIFRLISLPSATELRRLCFYRCLSVHRGGACSRRGVCLSACWDTPLPRRPPTPCQGDPHPPPRRPPCQGYPPLPRRPPSAKETPPCQGDSPLAKETPPPRDGHCCGWYASYWNAFLFCN